MKCPKCGFVSYAGLAQCKKCGYPFTKAAAKPSSSAVTTLFPEGVRAIMRSPSEPLPAPKENPAQGAQELPTNETQRTDSADAGPTASQRGQKASSREDSGSAARSPLEREPQDWREELTERLEQFRERRARFQPEADAEGREADAERESERVEPVREQHARFQPALDSAGNLELDFESPDKIQDPLDDVPKIPDFLELEDVPKSQASSDDVLGTERQKNSGFDLEIGESAEAQNKNSPAPHAVPFNESDDEMMQLDAAPSEPAEVSLGEPEGKSLGEFEAKSPPMEILVGSSADAPAETETGTVGIILAPLGRRILAGLTDALVLVLGAAVFEVIFWRFCGPLSLVPLNIFVLGLIGVLLVFAYFAVFTAIASGTPGLLWMGCEIRNIQGDYPTLRESCWRGFGVLVSLSALMLGFVWACVDSNGLTWHDHMSGTVIAQAGKVADLAGLKAEN